MEYRVQVQYWRGGHRSKKDGFEVSVVGIVTPLRSVCIHSQFSIDFKEWTGVWFQVVSSNTSHDEPRCGAGFLRHQNHAVGVNTRTRFLKIRPVLFLIWIPFASTTEQVAYCTRFSVASNVIPGSVSGCFPSHHVFVCPFSIQCHSHISFEFFPVSPPLQAHQPRHPTIVPKHRIRNGT